MVVGQPPIYPLSWEYFPLVFLLIILGILAIVYLFQKFPPRGPGDYSLVIPSIIICVLVFIICRALMTPAPDSPEMQLYNQQVKEWDIAKETERMRKVVLERLVDKEMEKIN